MYNVALKLFLHILRRAGHDDPRITSEVIISGNENLNKMSENSKRGKIGGTYEKLHFAFMN